MAPATELWDHEKSSCMESPRDGAGTAGAAVRITVILLLSLVPRPSGPAHDSYIVKHFLVPSLGPFTQSN